VEELDETTVDRVDEVMVAPPAPPLLDPANDEHRALAEQLVAEARTRGVTLVGPGGLLSSLTKRVLETGLEAEMSEHLGYDKHAVAGRDGGNFRNGTRSKTVLTEIGPIELDVPGSGRHVHAPAGPQAPTPPRRRRRDGHLAHREGLTTGEVQAHLAEV
jgi:putative transposase